MKLSSPLSLTFCFIKPKTVIMIMNMFLGYKHSTKIVFMAVATFILILKSENEEWVVSVTKLKLLVTLLHLMSPLMFINFNKLVNIYLHDLLLLF